MVDNKSKLSQLLQDYLHTLLWVRSFISLLNIFRSPTCLSSYDTLSHHMRMKLSNRSEVLGMEWPSEQKTQSQMHDHKNSQKRPAHMRLGPCEPICIRIINKVHPDGKVPWKNIWKLCSWGLQYGLWNHNKWKEKTSGGLQTGGLHFMNNRF